MKKNSVVVLTVALLAVLISTAESAEFFTDKGSFWTGGSFSFTNEYVKGTGPTNIYMLSGTSRFFPTKYLIIGPAFSCGGVFQPGNNQTSYSLGPELGFAYGNHIPVVPYVISGVDYIGLLLTDKTSEGLRIPVNIGIMIPTVVDGLGFQAEIGYSFDHYTYGGDPDVNKFSISVGVCGIGKKMAISLLDSFAGLF